ncbi:MAG TPA: hypothetical protein VLE99_02460 [Candidatus Saccharimonadales bacterium]|nr:hypothetical protein [Candidatus Saccharimonadales bacterium]
MQQQEEHAALSQFADNYPLPTDQLQAEMAFVSEYESSFPDAIRLLHGAMSRLGRAAEVGAPAFHFPVEDGPADPEFADDHGNLDLGGGAPFFEQLVLTRAVRPTEARSASLHGVDWAIARAKEQGYTAVGDLPPETHALLEGLYALTGSRVMRNDRAANMPQGMIVRQGSYNGRVVTFVEQYSDGVEMYGGQNSLNVYLVDEAMARDYVREAPAAPSVDAALPAEAAHAADDVVAEAPDALKGTVYKSKNAHNLRGRAHRAIGRIAAGMSARRAARSETAVPEAPIEPVDFVLGEPQQLAHQYIAFSEQGGRRDRHGNHELVTFELPSVDGPLQFSVVSREGGSDPVYGAKGFPRNGRKQSWRNTLSTLTVIPSAQLSILAEMNHPGIDPVRFAELRGQLTYMTIPAGKQMTIGHDSFPGLLGPDVDARHLTIGLVDRRKDTRDDSVTFADHSVHGTNNITVLPYSRPAGR